MNKSLKSFLLKSPRLSQLVFSIASLLSGNIIRKKTNKLTYKIVYFKKTKIVIKGTGNIVEIGDYTILSNCTILISGNNNLIRIGELCFLNKTSIVTENDNNQVIIGNHTSIHGNTQLATIESTRITLGEDCMLSGDVHFRTGDSHSIINLEGKRINESKDINIGNHVWVGMRVICLKGSNVGNNCIIGAGSIVSGFTPPNCIIGGVPAKIIKQNTNWLRERI